MVCLSRWVVEAGPVSPGAGQVSPQTRWAEQVPSTQAGPVPGWGEGGADGPAGRHVVVSATQQHHQCTHER